MIRSLTEANYSISRMALEITQKAREAAHSALHFTTEDLSESTRKIFQQEAAESASGATPGADPGLLIFNPFGILGPGAAFRVLS